MSGTGAGRYLATLRTPLVARPLVSTFLGCLPIGFQSLAMLLLARDCFHSLGAGGIVAGCYGVANGVGMAGQGWLITRYGPRRVLCWAVVLHVPAMLAYAVVAQPGATPVPLYLTTALAGLGFPQLNGCLRGLWPRLVADPDQRQNAYALSSMLFETSVVAGPLAFTALLVVGSARSAVVGGAVLVLVSTLLFVTSTAVRGWQVERVRTRHGSAPTRRTGVCLLVFVAGGQGLTYGLTYVSALGLAMSWHAEDISGVFRAMLSVGAVAGSFCYGIARWRPRIESRLALILVLLMLAAGACAFAGAPLPLALLLVVFGAALSPVMVISSAVLDRLCPTDSVTGVYSTMLTASIVGGNIGVAAGGVVNDHLGAHWALLIAAGWTALVAAAVIVGRRSLQASRAPQHDNGVVQSEKRVPALSGAGTDTNELS